MGKTRRALAREKELRLAFSRILEITLEPISFQQQLKKILETIVSLSWMGALEKGALFLTNHKKELVLAVHHQLDPILVERCSKVAFGHCLCGQVALSKKILFKGGVDCDHDVSFQGMHDHGHFVVPIFGHDEEVIGILVLYLEPGHQQSPDESVFLETLATILSTTIINRDLQLRAEVEHIRLGKAQLDITEKLVTASEFRDTETGDHIKRMTQYSVALAKYFGLGKADRDLLRRAAPLHDIGKVGIPDSILLKEGPLNDEEFAFMKTHTTIGSDLLAGDHDLIRAGREVARSHHEHWNGRGYPDGIAGNQIPLFGRICALADVFDALTTKRPYKEPWPLEKTLDLIRSQRGKQFDPKVVDAFFRGLPKILEIQSRYANTSFNNSDQAHLVVAEMVPGIMQWQDKLSVGIEAMDNQHKYLINLINRLHGAVRDFNIKVTVEALLDMKSYATIHFSDEEKEMKDMGYPDLILHRRIHQSFIQKAEQLTRDMEISPMATSMDTVIFLKDWTVNHILAVDSGYSQFLAELDEKGGLEDAIEISEEVLIEV